MIAIRSALIILPWWDFSLTMQEDYKINTYFQNFYLVFVWSFDWLIEKSYSMLLREKENWNTEGIFVDTEIDIRYSN